MTRPTVRMNDTLEAVVELATLSTQGQARLYLGRGLPPASNVRTVSGKDVAVPHAWPRYWESPGLNSTWTRHPAIGDNDLGVLVVEVNATGGVDVLDGSSKVCIVDSMSVSTQLREVDEATTGNLVWRTSCRPPCPA